MTQVQYTLKYTCIFFRENEGGSYLYQSLDEFDPSCDVYKDYDKEENVL